MYKRFLCEFKVKITPTYNSFKWQAAIPILTVVPVPHFEKHLSIFNPLPASEPNELTGSF
jgi:hypothetical protein